MDFSKKSPLCKQCEWFDHAFVPSEGPLDAEIVFCGESPWRSEVEQRRPLVGASGQVYNMLLESGGFERAEVFSTNIVHCKPDELGQAIPKGVIELCTKLFLKRELAIIQPKLVVPMGNVALKAMGITSSITQARGLVKQVELEEETYNVLPTWHPSFINRSPAHAPMAMQDFRAMRYYLDNGHERPPNNDLDYRAVTTAKQIDHFFAEFAKAKYIAWDTETTGLDYRTDEILSMQWSFALKAGFCMPFYLLPYDENNGAKLLTTFNTTIITRLYELLHDSKKVYFFHNIKFDLRMMYRFFMETIGLPIQIDAINAHDTMAMFGLLDENTSQSLKEISKTYTDLRYSAAELAKVKDGKMKTVTLEDMTAYGTRDCDATRRIAFKFGKELREQNLWGVYAEHDASDRKIVNKLFEMELFGAPIDLQELTRLEQLMIEKREYFYRRMVGIIGHDFNPNSPDQLIKVLFDELQFPLPEQRTFTGKICTAKEVIDKLIEDFPDNDFLHYFRMHRNYESIDKTFVRGLRKKLWSDGRLRPDFNYTFTVSGRVVCRNPNLENIPREKEFEEGVIVSIRKMFRAPSGSSIIYADSAQIEFKTAAILSGDKKLIHALFVDREDFHALVARGLYQQYTETELKLAHVTLQLQDAHISSALRGKLIQEKQSCGVFLTAGRVAAKAFNFARIYGGQLAKLASILGVDEGAITPFLDRLGQTYPDFEQYLIDIPQRAIREGELVSPFHRRRRFPASLDEWVQREQSRKGSIFPPQCHAFGAKILLPDLSWKKVEELQVGDTLVGFEENAVTKYARRHWRTATVLRADHDTAHCYELHLETGETVTVTRTHWHLTINKMGFQNWVRTDRLWFGGKTLGDKFGDAKLHSRLSKAVIRAGVADTWDAGYIAGMFDADGSMGAGWDHRGMHGPVARHRNIQLGQMPNAAMNRVCSILHKYNFVYSLVDSALDTPMKRVTILGGQAETLRFLELFRPPRILGDFNWNHFGRLRTVIGARVLDAVYVGRKDIVRLQTSEGTYVADGYATHNSSAAYTIRAALVRTSNTFKRIGMSSHLFNQVYDSMLIESSNDEVSDACRIVATEMLAPVPELGNHSFSISLGTGQTWQDSEANAKKVFTLADLDSLVIAK